MSCAKKTKQAFAIAKVSETVQEERIRELVLRFWGEANQLMFDKEFDIARLPAYYAEVGSAFAGFVAFTELGNAVVIAALAVLPQYQNSGIGKSLIRKVKEEAIKTKKDRLLVSTSNDDLPALAFYQSLGFQIYEIKTDIIAKKHGKVVKGIGGLPVRDELRMRQVLS